MQLTDEKDEKRKLKKEVEKYRNQVVLQRRNAEQKQVTKSGGLTLTNSQQDCTGDEEEGILVQHWSMTVCCILLATSLPMRALHSCMHLLCTHGKAKAITNGRKSLCITCSQLLYYDTYPTMTLNKLYMWTQINPFGWVQFCPIYVYED